MLIDSHCHLNYFPVEERIDLINRARANGVGLLLTIATRFNDLAEILEITNLDENIFATIGIHPSEAKNTINIHVDSLVKAVKDNKKVIGIGETGLDYYYDGDSRDIQKQIFEIHIQAAKEVNVPLIVHSRDAEEDTFNMLKNQPNLKILMHCFTGSKNFMYQMLDLGAYISFSGIVTFKNATDLQDLVKAVPSNRILVETDAPYLAPVPMRGKKNEPSFVKYTADFIAKLRDISQEEIYKITSQNFRTLFGIN